MRRSLLALIALCLVAAACLTSGGGASPSWLKGNTHTHTLWSDGDGAPELVTDWYERHGYDFLVLSDHNVLSRGERWFPVDGRRLTEERVHELTDEIGRILRLHGRQGDRADDPVLLGADELLQE